ncbi:MAG: HNH endonuclease, partial [Neisseriaceae bacterium]|nr:HNH endonuclease [Neisseriaceae bacterium]
SDFIPIYGDIKSFAEAQTGLDYAIAAAGVVLKPVKAIKAADKIGDAAKKANDLAKAQDRINDLSRTQRPGKSFTPAQKDAVKNENRIRNDGVTKCENCGVETVPAQKHQSGVTPPSNETHIDHVVPKSKGGSGTADNGQVLCRNCNLQKGNK